MAYHMISDKQLILSVSTIVLAVAVCSWSTKTIKDYLDLPEVWMGQDGKCVKVINYKNGDGYNCQDKDIVLRKYITINVK